MENKIKISKLEDKVDSARLIVKVVFAGVSLIGTGISLVSGIKSIKTKKNDPDKYWKEKYMEDEKMSRNIAKAINKVAKNLE